MDFRCWKGRAHQRGAAVGPQPWRHPNVRPTVTLGCETSCPGFFFLPWQFQLLGIWYQLISYQDLQKEIKQFWTWTSAVPFYGKCWELYHPCCHKHASRMSSSLWNVWVRGWTTSKLIEGHKFFQTIIFSILRCICRSEVEKKGKRKWTSGRSFGTFQSVQNLLSCYLVYPW